MTVGAPLAPMGIVATPGSGSAALHWVAPTVTNGSPITGYVVTPYVGSTAQSASTFTTNATSRTITGLSNATTYTFRVQAKNGNGVGPSAVSSPLTVGTPIAPTGATGTGGNSQAIVKWTAPSSTNGAAVTAYVVTPYLVSIAQTPQTFNSTATTQTVTGLQNAKTYTFVVAAKNAARDRTGVECVAAGEHRAADQAGRRRGR